MNRRLFLFSALALAACDRSETAAQSPDDAAALAGAAVRDPGQAQARAFMTRNAATPGTRTLPSGVQYRVVRSGPADGARPAPEDEVKVHYEGTLTDGTVFDSSFERGVPAVMPLADLIPAWQEVVPLMRRGDEWIVTVPPEQGYGPEGRPPRIPAWSVLVFRLQLIDFLPTTANA